MLSRNPEFLPSATVVPEKVMFSQVPVILSTGGEACVVGGHEWQRGMRDRGGMRGRGRGSARWQERRPLQRTVRILLKCILVTSMFVFMYYSKVNLPKQIHRSSSNIPVIS